MLSPAFKCDKTIFWSQQQNIISLILFMVCCGSGPYLLADLKKAKPKNGNYLNIPVFIYKKNVAQIFSVYNWWLFVSDHIFDLKAKHTKKSIIWKDNIWSKYCKFKRCVKYDNKNFQLLLKFPFSSFLFELEH